MAKLMTEARIADPDGIYEALVAMHEGRGLEESLKLQAKLILLLANHIGDDEVVREAIALAAAARSPAGHG
ncbi:MAG: hypothetical protein KatS3mg119_1274 [Rhodothalassiaceae bacterium]|nr:MAG: hypothetical protein KatS3mg119_1274 [Rhodothalassiaceae bacterium]